VALRGYPLSAHVSFVGLTFCFALFNAQYLHADAAPPDALLSNHARAHSSDALDTQKGEKAL
jgi:hypothetical protein